jgi:prepilin-type processing-associated H-X9-DG protein
VNGYGTGNVNSSNPIDCVGMFNTNSLVAIKDVTDGTSNTFAMGEKYIKEFQDGNTDGNQYRFGFHSHRNTVSPMNGPALSAWSNTDCTFGSWHPGGAQFLFVDGSVHFLPGTIGMQLYQNLSNRADGNVTTLP